MHACTYNHACKTIGRSGTYDSKMSTDYIVRGVDHWKKLCARFQNLGISQKISGFPERFQDFKKNHARFSCIFQRRFHARFEDLMQDFRISKKSMQDFRADFNEDFCKISNSMNISTRFQNSSADFDRLILNFRMM